MKIFIGADHRGFAYKAALKNAYVQYQWEDVGCDSTTKTDYPIYAAKLCSAILANNQPESRGVLLCGSGIGMSIAANRFNNIYAALCWNESVTFSARNHDNANVLVLPADEISLETAIRLVDLFMKTPFAGGRYRERLCMLKGDV